ncbi:winged helix-turn-helix domain-containing protein [Pseudanabaena mucicola]|uniref:Response regulator transcription factor n=1 Tax=Pseudanabaena mucicola FACHB-723 TaxID=2692860 RepID=A0ABR8A2F8_9CYAN|nr:response regulator transcription factor [Pseudanabaena mucicola]MBD2189950.1 response regulator transcription factor [Pseudanabaena mucicola FACHB-723]
MLLTEQAPSAPKNTVGCVLVVEDEAIIQDAIALALQEEGYSVLLAEDGYNALQVAKTAAKLDLVILDVMLPSINGLDFCRILRHEGNNVPVLMISARGNESDRIVGLEVGADDYLSKPFGMRELVARCRALLRRSRRDFLTANNNSNNATTVYKFGDITMYPDECRVTINEMEVNLSPKEFRLLDLFMSHPRRVWSREQLLEKVWGVDFVGDSKTVDVHIRWLREKIEVDPSDPKHIVTVRGFGYRLG